MAKHDWWRIYPAGDSRDFVVNDPGTAQIFPVLIVKVKICICGKSKLVCSFFRTRVFK